MESMSEFEARLKHTQSRARVRARRGYASDAPQSRTPARGLWPVPIIATCVGLAVIGGLLALARDDIARLFPSTQPARQVSIPQTSMPRTAARPAEVRQVSLTKPLQGALDQLSDQTGL